MTTVNEGITTVGVSKKETKDSEYVGMLKELNESKLVPKE